MGLEPTTLRLRVSCSTDWASRADTFKYKWTSGVFSLEPVAQAAWRLLRLRIKFELRTNISMKLSHCKGFFTSNEFVKREFCWIKLASANQITKKVRTAYVNVKTWTPLNFFTFNANVHSSAVILPSKLIYGKLRNNENPTHHLRTLDRPSGPLCKLLVMTMVSSTKPITIWFVPR